MSRVLLVPLVGPFHTRFPRYNAFDVRDALAAAGVRALALAPLAPGALDDPAWQATDEIALPLAVVPWARRAGVALHEVGCPVGSPDAPGPAGTPGAAEDVGRFEEMLARFEAGQASLRQVRQVQGPIEELLAGPLGHSRVTNELVPAVAAYQRARAEVFGEGPGTGWLAARAAVMAERVLALPHDRVALLAAIDELPALEGALGDRAVLEELSPAPEPSQEARDRSLLDHAMQGAAEEPGALLDALRRLGTPEAVYLEANILLEHAHPAEALEALERAMRSDFQEPYYLPGFVLARLGQVYDMAGRRDDALRAYRGVLALGFAPPEAVDAARSGLAQPFGAAAGLVEGAEPPQDG